MSDRHHIAVRAGLSAALALAMAAAVAQPAMPFKAPGTQAAPSGSATPTQAPAAAATAAVDKAAAHAAHKPMAPAAAPQRAAAVEALSRLDLDIELARKRAELQRMAEQTQPGYRLPTYTAVYGSARTGMRATLLAPTGGQITVAAGDRIAAGVVVSSINSDGVELTLGKGKRAQRVALDPAAPAAAGGASGLPTPGVPLMAPQGPLPMQR